MDRSISCDLLLVNLTHHPRSGCPHPRVGAAHMHRPKRTASAHPAQRAPKRKASWGGKRGGAGGVKVKPKRGAAARAARLAKAAAAKAALPPPPRVLLRTHRLIGRQYRLGSGTAGRPSLTRRTRRGATTATDTRTSRRATQRRAWRLPARQRLAAKLRRHAAPPRSSRRAGSRLGRRTGSQHPTTSGVR